MIRLMIGVGLTLTALALAVAQGNSADARKTFDFKGDALGESFDQFSSRHVDTGIECSGDADLLAKHGLTDEYQELSQRYNLKSEVTHSFYCSLKGGKQTLAGAETRSVEYRFFSDKLYEIDIRTYGYGGDAYRDIKAAYVDRFGEPAKTESDVYQNGFGAISHGEHCMWIEPDHPYRLKVTDGPSHGYVTVEFIDSNAKEAIEKLRPKKTGDT